MTGNLNSSKRPWLSFWKRRALRPEDAWVKAIVAEYGGSLLDDKGGDQATAGERHSIELASLARGVSCLLLDALAREGGATGPRGGELLGALARFMTLEQNGLRAVGLDRRAVDIDPLAAEWAAHEAELKEREKASPRGAREAERPLSIKDGDAK